MTGERIRRRRLFQHRGHDERFRPARWPLRHRHYRDLRRRDVTLQKQAGDGTTYVTALTGITAASYATVYLSSGKYRLAITTATAVYVQIGRIPLSRGGG